MENPKSAHTFSVTDAGCDNQPTLKELFKNDFYIGVAVNSNQIAGEEPDAIAIVEKHFNSITSENVLKWDQVRPEPYRFDFEAADRFVEFGEKNNMFIVGHPLVWHNQTPDWVFQGESGRPVDREVLLERMKEHIFTVAGRYKGRIHGWDVVNEAIADDGSMRRSKWLEIIGDDYIIKAFEYARQADPDAQLYYNDYNLWKRHQYESGIRLIQNLQSKGVRIDGVGIQGHWGLDYPGAEEIEAFILAFSKLGIKLMITELDVSVLPVADEYEGRDISSLDTELQEKLNPYTDALPETVQKELANRYDELFSIFCKHRDKFSRITLWGVHDGQSWRSYTPVRGRTDYPMLFDRWCKPKPAFDAVVKIAKNRK
jgi:endo-1,4-beta-xylanase